MVKRFVLMILLAVVLLTLSISPLAAQTEEDPITRIDQALNAAIDINSFSGSVLIARDGEILLSKGYGLANREWDNPNTPDTKFRIGWLTMQFTAMSILILQERGLLTVEDSVCQYFEECPEAWEAITIHHLLTHTSSIRDFTLFRDYWATMSLRSRPEDTIERFINEPVSFGPGENWAFSNSNYIVLGYIIEQVSGDSYQKFLKENIFDPLAMTYTGYYDYQLIIEHRAEGYESGRRKADYIHKSIPYAASGLYSTTEDLYVWTQALFGGEVVLQESWDAMVEAAFPNPFEDLQMEWSKAMYGLFMWSMNGHTAISHGSMVNGFGGQMLYYPDDKLTIIILSNFERQPFGLAVVIADILFDD